MPLDDFRVPRKAADLETSAAGSWQVRKKVDVESTGVTSLLKDAAARVKEDAIAISEEGTFGLAYWALHSFTQLTVDVRSSLCELATKAVQQAARECKRALLASASDFELAQSRSVLVASVYLLSWFVQEAEKMHASATLAATTSKAGKAKGGKKAVAKDSVTWAWEPYREQAALRLLEALDIGLHELWGHRSPDEEFVLLFTRSAYTILEQPGAIKSGTGSLRDAIWRLISVPSQRYEQAEATVNSLIRLVLEDRTPTSNMATHVAELCEHLLTEHEAVKTIADLLRELAALPTSDMGADSAGPKNIAAFLHALAAHAPLMLIANIELLQPHLNAEAYSLRCGAVSAHGQLLIQTVQLQADPDVAAAAVGLTLRDLCEARALPTANYLEAAEQGLQRLADKNSNVRRSALQLFGTLLEFNPFAPSLNRPKLEQVRDEVAARLASDVSMDASAPEGGEDAHAPQDGETNNPGTDVPKSKELEALDLALSLEAAMRSRLSDVLRLLGSQTNSDVTEATQAVVTAHAFGLEGARPAAVLTLVFSKEPSIKAAALQAAQSVYVPLTMSRRGVNPEQVQETARGLLALVGEASLAELTSLEEVVAEWQREALLPECFYSSLWEIVEGKRYLLSASSDRCSALALLNMAATGDAQLLRRQMELLIQQLQAQVHMLTSQPNKTDLAFIRHLCVALQRCASGQPISAKVAKAVTRAMERLLVTDPPSTQSSAWFGAAEKAVDVIFAFSDAPEELSSATLHAMSASLTRDDGERVEATACPQALSRLLFCVGHIALKMQVHIEKCEKALAQRRQALDNVADAQPASGKKNDKKSDAGAATSALSEELGTDAAAAAEDCEYLLSLGARLLEPDALLGAWAPLVEAVCVNADGQFGSELRSSAVLSLCKLMCVSAEFCDAKLRLLFSVMLAEPEQTIRANIAIALGDMAVMHPNVVERWTPQLYAQLRDREPRVRKNMLMVLTHLILNDMIKVKGQVSEIALCLLDNDSRIVSLARLFFSEFAKKASAPIYNLLPDMVSSLSHNESLQPEAFKEIFSFLIGFVLKGKQTESLVDKFCPRFTLSDQARHHQDISFCVCALPHSDKSIRKLQEHFKTFGNKLGDAEVYANFTGLVARARKGSALQPELKPVLDDFEALLERSQSNESNEGGFEQTDESQPSAAIEAPAALSRPTTKSARRKGRSVSKKAEPWENDDADKDEENLDADDANENLPPTKSAQPASKVVQRGATRSRRGRVAAE